MPFGKPCLMIVSLMQNLSQMTTQLHKLNTIILSVILSIPAFASPPGGGGSGADLCSGVVPVAVNEGDQLTLTGDNSTATSTGDFDPASPFFPFNPEVVWHAFTTTECLNITIDYCGQTPVWVPEDTWGFLFTTCPANEIIQPTGFDPALCGDGNSTYTHTDLAPGTYYLPVRKAGTAIGAYSINLVASACATGAANDLCADVVPSPLAIGATLTFNGDNSAATATDDFVPGSVLAGAPVSWHAFTTTSCSYIVVDYCGTSPTWTNALGMLLSTCPGDENVGAPLSAFNQGDCSDGNFTYYFNAVPPGTYYIPVLCDQPNNSCGPYTINVTANSCGGTVNDYCADVTPMVMEAGSSTTFTGNNTGATDLNDFTGPPFAGTPVAWHAVSLLSCTDLTIAYCGTVPAWGNTLGIISASCPSTEQVQFSDADTTSCGNSNWTYVFEDLAAGTYYIPVMNDPFNNSSGPYEIEVTADLCSGIGVAEHDRSLFMLFPNPADGTFTLVNGSNSTIEQVDVIDVAGRIVHSINRNILSQASTQITLHEAAAGIYTVRMMLADGRQMEQRLMVR